MVRWRDGKVVFDASPGVGGTHGAAHEFLVESSETEHPIMQGLPTAWRRAVDELYSKLRGPAKNLTVLATAKAEPGKGGGPESEPMGRCRPCQAPIGRCRGDARPNRPRRRCHIPCSRRWPIPGAPSTSSFSRRRKTIAPSSLSCGRTTVGRRFSLTNAARRKVLFAGKVTPAGFDLICDYVIKEYFQHPSYWRTDAWPYFSLPGEPICELGLAVKEALRSGGIAHPVAMTTDEIG